MTQEEGREPAGLRVYVLARMETNQGWRALGPVWVWSAVFGHHFGGCVKKVCVGEPKGRQENWLGGTFLVPARRRALMVASTGPLLPQGL